MFVTLGFKLNNFKIVVVKRILQMIESGLTEYWRRRLWPSIEQCDPQSYQKQGPRSLKLDDIQSPFLIWAIGICSAVIVFLIENSFFILKKKCDRK